MSDEVQIALFGFIATGFVAVVSQWMQSRREKKRLQTEVEERRNDRIYEHRRNAYAAFAGEFESMWGTVYDYIVYEGKSGMLPDDALGPVFERLPDLRLFGTFETFESARAAAQEMFYWLFGGQPEGREGPTGDEVYERFRVFLDQARVDLGADEWPESAFE